MQMIDSIVGNLKEDTLDYKGKTIDYVDVDWHETHKKIHRRITNQGIEIGMKFDDHILIHGLKQDDILYQDDEKIIAVNIPPCDALVVEIEDAYLVPKVCYEIGNKHAPFFRGDTSTQFITPYDKPLEVLLQKLKVKVEHKQVKLDFTKAISTSLGGHHH